MNWEENIDCIIGGRTWRVEFILGGLKSRNEKIKKLKSMIFRLYSLDGSQERKKPLTYGEIYNVSNSNLFFQATKGNMKSRN